MLTCVIIIHIGLVQLKVLEHARNQEGGAALGSQVCSGTPETERGTKGKYVMESKKSICKALILRYTMQKKREVNNKALVCVCVCVCVFL